MQTELAATIAPFLPPSRNDFAYSSLQIRYGASKEHIKYATCSAPSGLLTGKLISTRQSGFAPAHKAEFRSPQRLSFWPRGHENGKIIILQNRTWNNFSFGAINHSIWSPVSGARFCLGEQNVAFTWSTWSTLRRNQFSAGMMILYFCLNISRNAHILQDIPGYTWFQGTPLPFWHFPQVHLLILES